MEPNPSTNSRFKALVFDLGKVIIDFDSMRPLQKLSGRTPYSLPELVNLLKGTDAIHRYESGRLTSEAFYAEITELLKLSLDFEEFIDVWSDIFSPQLILDPSLFERLRAKYRLILMSNTNPMHAAYLDKHYPFLQIFHSRIYSHEVGAMKPDQAIYRKATEAAHAGPEHIFYVDDIPAFVEAAIQTGWTAVQFINKDRLLRDMRNLKIEF